MRALALAGVVALTLMVVILMRVAYLNGENTGYAEGFTDGFADLCVQIDAHINERGECRVESGIRFE